jgi:serine protease Do
MLLSRRVLWGLALCEALLTTGSIAAAEKAKNSEAEQERRVEVVRIGSAYLGVSLDEVTKDEMARLKLPEERGALVRSVEEGSPAQKGGLKADDVIVRFQGESVHTGRQLARLVREQPAGRTVAIEVVRGGATQRVQATLEERKGAQPEWRFEMPDLKPPLPPQAPNAPLMQKFFWGEGGPRRLGIEYQEIGDQLAKYFKLAGDRGVLVSRVEEDGPAGKAGIKAGDVVLKIEGRSVRDGGDLRDELRKAEPGSEVSVTVQRDGKPVDFKIKLAGSPEPRRTRGFSS